MISKKFCQIRTLTFIFEAIVGEEPAYSYLSEAIEKGCHVITANKTMFAKHGPALLKHAEVPMVFKSVMKQQQQAAYRLSVRLRTCCRQIVYDVFEGF